MNQIQRDLTYRLDALQSYCVEHGFESEECQTSIQIWEQQHSMNVWTSKISTVFFTSVIFIVCCVVFFHFYMKILIKTAKNKEKLKMLNKTINKTKHKNK